jgi:methylenetetrahydrofolate dehydrogenase (NADP+) / methenyltetrahydrofolate cyclohydrolase
LTAVRLDGKAVSERLLLGLAPRVNQLRQAGRNPHLCIVRVGHDPASTVYVASKLRACRLVGIEAQVREFPDRVAEEELLQAVEALNADARVHGVIVQLPLPRHLDAHRVASSVSPHKDVDGFHECNLGKLLRGDSSLVPCTPAGVLRLLDEFEISLQGRHAVVVGRSEIVGKPMALMLLGRHATVTVCHSRTAALSAHTTSADVLISATGQPGLITPRMVKLGAAVIDVGITRSSDGRLVGDVDPGAAETAGFLTPVPGGVGPMTVAMLMANTVAAAESCTS